MRRAAMLALAAALVAGCGSGSTHVSTGGVDAAGAGVAPKASAFFLRVDSSFESAQWQAFASLLKMFPGGEKALAQLGGEGIREALGAETDVIALNRADLDKSQFVGITQSDDKARLQTLLSKDTDTPR